MNIPTPLYWLLNARYRIEKFFDFIARIGERRLIRYVKKNNVL